MVGIITHAGILNPFNKLTEKWVNLAFLAVVGGFQSALGRQGTQAALSPVLEGWLGSRLFQN
jgi:hypothetical protein